MLAQTDGGRVFSRVLAGSRSASDDGELAEADRRAFRADAKELSEHAFAVDSVLERLEGLAEDIGVSPEPFVLRSEEHTSELQSRGHLVCRLLLEKKKT